MIIQINTDKTIEWNQRNSDHFSGLIKEELDRFRDNITRVEVHISDENGSKKGPDDIRCLVEVRVDGRPPVVGIDQSGTVEQAISGALEKVKASLKSILVH